MLIKNVFFFFIFLLSSNVIALPIDWNGEFRFDTFRISDYRYTQDSIAQDPNNLGTQEIPGDSEKATFQAYLIKLQPTLIVNDSVSIKGELTSGFARGGFFGDNTTQDDNSVNGSRLPGNYHFTTSNVDNALIINQLYAELYADTATYRIGRFSKHWGLGVMFNNGSNSGDRFFTLYDGFEAEFKLGNFILTPHWTRLGQDPNGLTSTSEVRDIGIEAAYDNPDKSLVVGFMYNNRKSGVNARYLQDETISKDTGSNVKIMDLFIKKSWEKFDFAVEIPFLSGDIVDVYNTGTTANNGYDAKAYIVETNYRPNASWNIYFHGGQVSGDNGDSNSFGAMYLHPNYNIANLMLSFNSAAAENANGNFFYSPISNVRFYKFGGDYMSGNWKWKMSYVMANALETATAGRQAYNHQKGSRFNATQDQSDSYGSEIDLGFEYNWNPGVVLAGDLGYMLTGDFYKFSNSTNTRDVENPLYLAMSLSILF